ncbi:hypothetical protein [Salinisphaera sp.]|uniref:RIFT barrel domain-containing protein n=1 Tax=Salinisphaera sp. TaxID=1914330 RepID=UPI002D76FF83|nr:hypothetical protein [Salinisphaera sp.]
MGKSFNWHRPFAGVIGLLSLLFSIGAGAWTYDDLSPQQKTLYDRQQNFINYVYERAGLKPPKVPYSLYLGPDTRGDNPDITEITVRNRSDHAADYSVVTYGQVFKKGDYQPDKRLLYSTPGNPSDQGVQSDIKTYYDDGSVKHAILSFQLDRVPEHGSEKLKIFTRGNVSDNAGDRRITIGGLLASGFHANIEIRRDGRVLTQNARALLQSIVDRGGCDAVPDTVCKTWLSGTRTSEWIIGGGHLQGAETDRDNQLAVYFHVRAHAGYSGRIANARVDTVVENDFTYGKTAGDLRYDATITVGEHSFTVEDLTHYYRARWHKVLWWGNDPHLYVRPDMQYLQATRAIPNYADIRPDEAELASLPSSYPLMAHGDQTKHMGNVGAQAGIGPLPRWTTLYAISGDPRAFDYMLANDDAVGSYGFHFRDAATGRPVTIADHPYITTVARRDASWWPAVREDLYTACSGDCHSPYEFNLAHHPSIGFVPYLVTGDYYYLEELQFAAAEIEVWANPKYRGESLGRLRVAAQQVRQQAWSLRTIAQAAYATPDADPLHDYFTGLMHNIAADYKQYYLQHPDRHPLHILDNYTNYPIHGNPWVGVAPWQEDFFAWSVSYASDLGFSEFTPFAQWLLQFQIHRMTDWIASPDRGFCWTVAATYALQVRPTRGAPFFSSMDEAYKATLPHLNGLDCDSQEFRNHMSSSTQAGEMIGYPRSPTGFPSNLQPALAATVDQGLAKGRQAWDVFNNRSIKPRYNNYPNWAIVPRP